MKIFLGYVAIVCATLSGLANAQPGRSWDRVPTITVVSSEGDARLGLVVDAVAFWNKTLEEIGSGFRLGSVTHVVQSIPEEALQSLSLAGVQGGRGGTSYVPASLRNLPGDLTVFLAESAFISFCGPFDGQSKRVVGIRGASIPPMTLPNVARNVIAHELGHAIGLSHNGDPATLMCGRPAPCRPDLFRSEAPLIFPVTSFEKHQLLWMYPTDWKPKPP
jgi:hypothetical protein